MKLTFVNKFLFLPLLLFSAMAQAQISQISLDMAALAGTQTIEKTADFSKGFDIDLTNNTAGATPITITNSLNIPVTLKSSILPADAALIALPFRFNASTNQLVLTFNGVSTTVGAPIQLTYGNKVIRIRNGQQGTGGNGNPNPQPGVMNGNAAAANDIISAPTGIPLHDAILAGKYYKAGSDSLFYLLGELKSVPAGSRTKAGLLSAQYYGSNPFIKQLLNSYTTSPLLAGVQVGSSGGISGILSKLGNVDVTTIADGIARFLVKRTKEELNAAFFQRFKDFINKDEYKDARILFPKTLQVLNSIDVDIYKFENYINSLREAFDNDLSLLLDHMPEVIQDGHFKDYFNDHLNVKYAALLAIFAGKELLNGTHPGQMIADLPSDYIDSFTEKNVSGAIKTVQLLSSSLRARGGDRYWSTTDSVKMLANKSGDFLNARFYLGFLYDGAGGINFNSDSLRAYLTKASNGVDSVDRYVAFVRQMAQQFQDVEAAIGQVKDKSPGEPSIDVYNRLFNAVADALDEINTINQLPYMRIDAKITGNATRYIKVFRLANDLALNVARRSYSLAVTDAYNIYLTITSKENANKSGAMEKNNDLYVSRTALATEGRKEVKKANTIVADVSDFIRKYGAFMSNVVKAKSSEEVANAIEAAALPVGSASIKKHSAFNLAIQAYTGLSATHLADGTAGFAKINGMNVYAPVGIAASTRIGGSSVSIFGSLIDVGAIVSYRFKDATTNLSDSVKIRLENIFAPGANLVWGLPKWPISIGGGFQWQPSLTRLSSSSATIATKSGMRYHVFIGVDIPLFNLVNVPRKK